MVPPQPNGGSPRLICRFDKVLVIIMMSYRMQEFESKKHQHSTWTNDYWFGAFSEWKCLCEYEKKKKMPSTRSQRTINGTIQNLQSKRFDQYIYKLWRNINHTDVELATTRKQIPVTKSNSKYGHFYSDRINNKLHWARGVPVWYVKNTRANKNTANRKQKQKFHQGKVIKTVIAFAHFVVFI